MKKTWFGRQRDPAYQQLVKHHEAILEVEENSPGRQAPHEVVVFSWVCDCPKGRTREYARQGKRGGLGDRMLYFSVMDPGIGPRDDPHNPECLYVHGPWGEYKPWEQNTQPPGRRDLHGPSQDLGTALDLLVQREAAVEDELVKTVYRAMRNLAKVRRAQARKAKS